MDGGTLSRAVRTLRAAPSGLTRFTQPHCVGPLLPRRIAAAQNCELLPHYIADEIMTTDFIQITGEVERRW